jgi:hypothetical protein
MTMVEKVARAMVTAMAKHPESDYPDKTYDDILEEEPEAIDFINIVAKAAIEAMREPTEEMAKASYEALLGKDINWDGDYMKGHKDRLIETHTIMWQGMIDAAHKES